MESIPEENGGGTGHWSLCDGKFTMWDRGDTIAEIVAGGWIVAWVQAIPLENDPDWEMLYERGTAFPGTLLSGTILRLPHSSPGNAQIHVESIEHLERILYECELNPIWKERQTHDRA
jgi:hypothetical protein